MRIKNKAWVQHETQSLITFNIGSANKRIFFYSVTMLAQVDLSGILYTDHKLSMAGRSTVGGKIGNNCLLAYFLIRKKTVEAIGFRFVLAKLPDRMDVVSEQHVQVLVAPVYKPDIRK